ncbi:MAG: hypothetical protein Q8P67_07590, partial [archaeon]|nr:hypothetical protein [archaeon]
FLAHLKLMRSMHPSGSGPLRMIVESLVCASLRHPPLIAYLDATYDLFAPLLPHPLLAAVWTAHPQFLRHQILLNLSASLSTLSSSSSCSSYSSSSSSSSCQGLLSTPDRALPLDSLAMACAHDPSLFSSASDILHSIPSSYPLLDPRLHAFLATLLSKSCELARSSQLQTSFASLFPSAHSAVVHILQLQPHPNHIRQLHRLWRLSSDLNSLHGVFSMFPPWCRLITYSVFNGDREITPLARQLVTWLWMPDQPSRATELEQQLSQLQPLNFDHLSLHSQKQEQGEQLLAGRIDFQATLAWVYWCCVNKQRNLGKFAAQLQRFKPMQYYQREAFLAVFADHRIINETDRHDEQFFERCEQLLEVDGPIAQIM